MIWFLYVLETADGTFYTGITNDLDRREAAHNAGKGAKYTASRRPVKIMAAWQTEGRGSATRLERAFKRLSRAQKEQFVKNTTAPFQEAVRVC